MQKTPCPYKRLGIELNCPFKDICKSYSGDIGLRILSQKQSGGRELVVAIENLHKLL